MIQAVQEVQETGEAMGNSAREFAADPCSSSKRGNMVMNNDLHSRIYAWVWS